ncbi:methionyl-tRNA formyltransferase [Chloroflexota bacterium]
MRIVFVGTVNFSRHCLKEVLENGGNVVALFTLDKAHTGFHSDYADLSDIANEHVIPVYDIKDIKSYENIELIRSLEPDVIFVFGWSQLIPKQILDIPSLGCIGTHPALLPLNRGRHPIIWALVEGLEKSGLTFFYIDEGMDSGDILWQKSFPITLEDNAESIYMKIKGMASEAIQDFLPQLQQGNAPRMPQDNSQASYWRKRTEKDGTIHWKAPTMQTYNLIRALTHPYVGAHTYIKGKKTLIWRAQLPQKPLPSENQNLLPGTIFAVTNTGFNIRTGDDYLTILEYEPKEGRGDEIKAGIQIGGQV